MGYHRAGFDVVGVDIAPQPRFPFDFVQDDALACLRWLLDGYAAVSAKGVGYKLSDFAAIHASPPCQAYTRASFTSKNRGRHPALLEPTRALLIATGKPWVMENVPGAPVRDHPIELCGLMFGLKVFRHRFFESSAFLLCPPHPPHGRRKVGVDGFRSLVGHGGGASARQRRQMNALGVKDDKRSWVDASGIDWMTRDEMAQAIPPAYTEFVGRQLLALVAE